MLGNLYQVPLRDTSDATAARAMGIGFGIAPDDGEGRDLQKRLEEAVLARP
jgi:hypothetical protein